jgi:hypothetical protein
VPTESDKLYPDNLGGVQDKHVPNTTSERPRGYYASKIAIMGGNTAPNYWKQPGHPMSEKQVTHDRQAKFWKPGQQQEV